MKGWEYSTVAEFKSTSANSKIEVNIGPNIITSMYAAGDMFTVTINDLAANTILAQIKTVAVAQANNVKTSVPISNPGFYQIVVTLPDICVKNRRFNRANAIGGSDISIEIEAKN